MNERTENQSPDPELSKRIAELPSPLPNPAYVERSRKMFTGRLPFGRVDEHFDRRSAARTWLWAGAGIAAAAALALALIFSSTTSDWQIADAGTTGSVLINDEVTDGSTLTGTSLASGTRIATLDHELSLTVEDALTLVLAPFSDVTVSTSRGFTGPSLVAVVHEGTAWGTTGEAFPRSGLQLETAQVFVHVTGTTFSVLSTADSTCVCVLSGTVEVNTKADGQAVMIPEEQALFVGSDNQPARLTSLTSGQRQRLLVVRGLGGSAP